MKFEIEEQTYNDIAQVISFNYNTFPIDAKKIHLTILNALADINSKLDQLENEITSFKNKGTAIS